MAELPQRWVVVCEHRSDADIACGLADRVAVEPDSKQAQRVSAPLDAVRRWSGEDPDPAGNARPLLWSRVKQRARALGISPHGYGRGGVEGIESAEIRKVIAVVTHKGVDRPAGVLLVRDTDGDQDRRRSYRTSVDALNAAYSGAATPMRALLALPHPEMEAWLLAGFDPSDDDERDRLKAARTRLGVDPRERSHELNPGRTATDAGRVKNSTKNALDDLCADDHDRKRQCWEGASIAVLRKRGEHNGLAEFLNGVVTQYVASLKGAR
ncbi:MAG: hypothetical protein IPN17_10335 [Deltaproteobacteria bacterium]|jgi:hypothetical protein|nr:hypothetical protein [Deltaproteobacteria bacterium]